ncbi:hypothetical protein DU508_04170 [Pedobacter chinensis]|uniref:Uncharacterized protein n=1 Tax=Pedobacter chinensis TaxID=2282421 RepID=A0A369Q5E4_9SPHI|nr:hypothetical protein [Pedobacter chinensis]RDC58149.1 hypothetical protein DU508_04170 [Pedobacter chinensis]
MDIKEFIPEQLVGQQTDAVEQRSFSNETEAKEFYQLAKSRMLNVGQWHQISKMEASVFNLLDSDGKQVNRNVKVGDFVSIDIPGPGTKIGNGNDYIKVEHLEEISDGEDESVFYMRFRPSAPPGKPRDKTAHFFKADATSTFMVTRKAKTVSAEVHGRNEIPNMSTDKLIDKARNTIIAVSGFLGISVLQWKLLVKGVLS